MPSRDICIIVKPRTLYEGVFFVYSLREHLPTIGIRIFSDKPFI